MDKRRIGVRAIIYQNGKILAVKHKSRKDGKPKDFWAIPGGGLDPGETLEDGLKREMLEELGISAMPGRLLFIQQFRSTRTDCDEELEFFFLVESSEDFNKVDLSKTSHGADEISECVFIDPRTEYVLPDFLSEIDVRSYAQALQPVLVVNRFV